MFPLLYRWGGYVLLGWLVMGGRAPIAWGEEAAISRINLRSMPLPPGIEAGELRLDLPGEGGIRLELRDRNGARVGEIRAALFDDEASARALAKGWAASIQGRVFATTGAFGENAVATEAGTLLIASQGRLAYRVSTETPSLTGDASVLARGLAQVSSSTTSSPLALELRVGNADGRRGVPVVLEALGGVEEVRYTCNGCQVVRTRSGARLYGPSGMRVSLTAYGLSADLRMVTVTASTVLP